MKKISTTFILIAAIICLSVTALAAGLIFSPKYEATKVAGSALKEQYGITDELQSLFTRTVTENGHSKGKPRGDRLVQRRQGYQRRPHGGSLWAGAAPHAQL